MGPKELLGAIWVLELPTTLWNYMTQAKRELSLSSKRQEQLFAKRKIRRPLEVDLHVCHRMMSLPIVRKRIVIEQPVDMIQPETGFCVLSLVNKRLDVALAEDSSAFRHRFR